MHCDWIYRTPIDRVQVSLRRVHRRATGNVIIASASDLPFNRRDYQTHDGGRGGEGGQAAKHPAAKTIPSVILAPASER